MYNTTEELAKAIVDPNVVISAPMMVHYMNVLCNKSYIKGIEDMAEQMKKDLK